jgi:putative endonuclease
MESVALKYLNFPFYMYILTNLLKTVVYVGFTNNIEERVAEHYAARGNPKTFTGRYNCHILVYLEGQKFAMPGIRREKQVKKWSRKKKDQLINSQNPYWENLYLKIFNKWPPGPPRRKI